MNVETDSHTHHISQQFNNELDDIKSHMLEMGGMVELQVRDAIRALIDVDSAMAEKVVHDDRRINLMEVSIDTECARILARRQPAASDLRLVIAVTKAINDLERIGDEATKVARHSLDLIDSGASPRGYVEVRHIGDQVTKMVHNALDAFARVDIDQALRVVRTDKTVDLEYGTAMRELMTYMMEDPRSISRVMNVVWALRSLERIGDHARNIAQYVVYLVKGEDVRHAGIKELEDTYADDIK